MLKFDRSKLVKNLAQGRILIPYLDRVFDTFEEPWAFAYTEKEIDDAWHPSGDCTPSVTTLYDQAKLRMAAGPERVRPEFSGALRKSFMVGHFWHQLLQYIILNKLEFCKPEAIERVGQYVWDWQVKDDVTFEDYRENQETNEPAPFHWVRGSGDIVPLVAPGGWTGLVDIKTMSSQQFKQNVIPAWAAAKYECQMNVYMQLFDQPQAMILAVNKDAPHDFKEYIFDRNQSLIDTIFKKWEFVSGCLDLGIAPIEDDNDMFPLKTTGPVG